MAPVVLVLLLMPMLASGASSVALCERELAEVPATTSERGSRPLTMIRTATTPPFLLTLLDPAVMQTAKTSQTGKFVEWRLDGIIRAAMRAEGHRALLLDVGANIGFAALTAASLGHRAVAFEPIAAHYSRLKASLCLNGFQGLVRVVEKGVAEHPQTLRAVGYRRRRAFGRSASPSACASTPSRAT